MAEPELLEKQAAEELACLVEQARRAEPPPLDGVKQYQMVRAALRETGQPAHGARRVTRYALGLAAALLMGLLGVRAFESVSTRLAASHIEVGPSSQPLRLQLRTGDALVLARDTGMDVLSETPARRVLRLTRGAALFDVTHLAQGQSFEVVTAHARAQVRGTVFSVQVDSRHTEVHVHEGAVQVAGRVLQAGARWSSGSTGASSGRAPFAAEVRAALAARRAGPAQRSEPAASLAPPRMEPLPPSATTTAPAATLTPDRSRRRPHTGPPPAPTSTRQASVDATPPTPELPTPEAAELLLRQGQAEPLLQALGEHGEEPRYARVFADALRASGDFARAIVAYEALASQSQGDLRSLAGYAAAQLALGPLHDPLRALDEIERFDLTEPASPLRERAGVLRIDALAALGRIPEARAAARDYLAREPETETSARLRRLLESAQE